jgi:CBS domain-containing protein
MRVEEDAMVARDVMTADVVTVSAETAVPEIAALLLEHRISAVPVVDAKGGLLGIVSEGDLMRRPEAGTEVRRRSWWLRLFSDQADLARDFVKTHGLRATDVMTREVVTVGDDTPLAAIAQILEERRIKRVPVVRGERLVGIVSRADLLRAVAARWPRSDAAAGKPDDRAIRERLLETIRSAEWVTDAFVNVMVTDGVVHLWGVIESDVQRDALRVAAERIPGVRAVEDHLGNLPPWSAAI